MRTSRILTSVGVFAAFLLSAEVYAISGPFVYSHSIETPHWAVQALTSDGTNLFYIDEETLYTVDPSDGQIINSFAVPFEIAELGLAHNGTNLFALDTSFSGGNGFVYEIDPSNGTVINTFGISGGYFSATFFNDDLYVFNCDYYPLGRPLEVLDTSNGDLLDSFNVPLYGGIWWYLGGLTTYGSTLIGAVGPNADGVCIEIDPYSGERLSAFRLGEFAQGIRGLASDGTRLFATGIVSYNSSGPGRIDVYERIPEGTPWAAAIILPGGIYVDGSWSSGSSEVVSWLWDLDADEEYDDASGPTPGVRFDDYTTIGLKVITSDGAEDWVRVQGEGNFVVPEPATLLLLAPALLGFAGIALRRMSRR